MSKLNNLFYLIFGPPDNLHGTPKLQNEECQAVLTEHQVVVHSKSVESEAWLLKMRRVQRRKTVEQAIKERDQLAERFLERKNNDNYYRIIANPVAKNSANISTVNLMQDGKSEVKKLVEELREYAEAYFDYDTDLFKFYERNDKNLSSFWRAPLVHADMEEENIEERFPQEIRSRALMVALGKVIQRNQWANIVKKRKIQFYFTVVPVLVGVTWPSTTGFFSAVLFPPLAFIDSVVVRETAEFTVSLVIFLILFFIYWLVSSNAMRTILSMMTIIFNTANEISFAHVRVGLSSFASSIHSSFPKLFSDIEGDQNIAAEFVKEEWPDKAQNIFEIAIWQGKRLEYVERFAQIQHERLRIFELFSDAVGNISSRAISFAAALATLIALITIYRWDDWLQIAHMVAIASSVAFISWVLGGITRESAYSFSIRDILKQGAVEEGNSFIDLDYYKSISNQFKSSKAALQREFLRTNR